MPVRESKNYRSIPSTAIKVALPNTTQTTSYSCGASALLAVCAYYGVGPEDEWDVMDDMKLKSVGSDPYQLSEAAASYGLGVIEHRGMSDAELRRQLTIRRPVIVMLQAWPSRPVRSWKHHWADGHWVVAIGFDKRQGVDPRLTSFLGEFRSRAAC